MTKPGQINSEFINELFGAMDGRRAKLRRNIDGVMGKIDGQWAEANERVRGLLGASFTVDEMALYFTDESLLWTAVQQLVKREWELFNFAEDQVRTRPISGDYAVEYWFMRHDDYPYRLELMRVPDGFSPYHAMLDNVCQKMELPAVVAHASFKVSGEMAYANAVRVLGSSGYDLLQHCESSYGRFSYFAGTDASTMVTPTIKPRINIRDGGADSGN